MAEGNAQDLGRNEIIFKVSRCYLRKKECNAQRGGESVWLHRKLTLRFRTDRVSRFVTDREIDGEI